MSKLRPNYQEKSKHLYIIYKQQQQKQQQQQQQ